jgi:hypothetical protein
MANREFQQPSVVPKLAGRPAVVVGAAEARNRAPGGLDEGSRSLEAQTPGLSQQVMTSLKKAWTRPAYRTPPTEEDVRIQAWLNARLLALHRGRYGLCPRLLRFLRAIPRMWGWLWRM